MIRADVTKESAWTRNSRAPVQELDKLPRTVLARREGDPRRGCLCTPGEGRKGSEESESEGERSAHGSVAFQV